MQLWEWPAPFWCSYSFLHHLHVQSHAIAPTAPSAFVLHRYEWGQPAWLRKHVPGCICGNNAFKHQRLCWCHYGSCRIPLRFHLPSAGAYDVVITWGTSTYADRTYVSWDTAPTSATSTSNYIVGATTSSGCTASACAADEGSTITYTSPSMTVALTVCSLDLPRMETTMLFPGVGYR